MESTKKRCHACAQKLGLMVFRCSCCEQDFCISHRTPEDHACPVDFKTAALEKYKKGVDLKPIGDNRNYISI